MRSSPMSDCMGEAAWNWTRCPSSRDGWSPRAMNRAGSARVPLPSGWQVETRRLGALLQGYVTEQLNRFFDLSGTGTRRRRLQILLYVLFFAVAAFGAHLLLQIQLRSGAASPTDPGSLIPAAFIAGLRIILIIGIAAS